MRLACLFSGGKDSTYSLFKTLREGHEIICLITVHPLNDESLLFHYPNSKLLKKISEASDIPIVEGFCNINDKEYEIEVLSSTILQAIHKYSIEGIVSGVISSKFQLNIFQKICEEMNLELLSPIWDINPERYYEQLLNSDFEILITRVAAMGLDEKWLGKTIDKTSYNELKKNSKKYKFNITFEGGEAETFVLDCPFYKRRIEIANSKIHWDGVRGMFEITEMNLVQK